MIIANTSDESKALDASRLLYNKRFGYSYLTVSHDIQQLQKWYQNHIDRLNEQIMQIDTNTTDIQISKINNNNAESNAGYQNMGSGEIVEEINENIDNNETGNKNSKKEVGSDDTNLIEELLESKN